jgi:hypothetical protein
LSGARLTTEVPVLEIIVLFKLCQRIGRAARAKGRRAGGYQLLLVIFWFGAELGGGLLSVAWLVAVNGNNAGEYLFLAYLAAFAGAAVGAWLAFRIVASLPDPQLVEPEIAD